MWAVVYIASGKKQIGTIIDLLQKEGILYRLHYLGLPAEETVNAEILVSKSEVEEAIDLIHRYAF
jgi:hypothetical protein